MVYKTNMQDTNRVRQITYFWLQKVACLALLRERASQQTSFSFLSLVYANTNNLYPSFHLANGVLIRTIADNLYTMTFLQLRIMFVKRINCCTKLGYGQTNQMDDKHWLRYLKGTFTSPIYHLFIQPFPTSIQLFLITYLQWIYLNLTCCLTCTESISLMKKQFTPAMTLMLNSSDYSEL